MRVYTFCPSLIQWHAPVDDRSLQYNIYYLKMEIDLNGSSCRRWISQSNFKLNGNQRSKLFSFGGRKGESLFTLLPPPPPSPRSNSKWRANMKNKTVFQSFNCCCCRTFGPPSVCVCSIIIKQEGHSFLFGLVLFPKTNSDKSLFLMGPPPALDRYIVINKSKSPTSHHPRRPAGLTRSPKREPDPKGKKKQKQQQQQLDPWSIWGGEVIRIYTHTPIYCI